MGERNIETAKQMGQEAIVKEVVINATPAKVWKMLTVPELMSQWMGEPEMQLSVITDWQSGGSVVIRGINPLPFESTGKIIVFEPEQLLGYSHLSSLSGLADEAQNYTLLLFEVKPVGEQTQLSLTLSNFPTEIIFKHFDLYWNGTLTVLKSFAEQQVDSIS
ncbi:SRPBCC domain-containing protein [Mucilaginibacter angelicae]|uniref:SRPBCC domain-containing protein n=1 Tax=Mucilaginibacter angelicae TaxID=869718 RepID=A0ABV6L4U6_9SPHI